MGDHHQICSGVRCIFRSELCKDVHCIESIDHMLILRSHERVIFIKLHSVSSKLLKSVDKVLAYNCPLLRMSDRVMLT